MSVVPIFGGSAEVVAPLGELMKPEGSSPSFL